MLSLPIALSSAIGVFAPVFSRPVWQHVKVLLTGAVLAPLSWADRVWALPFVTALCPSERFYAQRGRRHQPLTARAWQLPVFSANNPPAHARETGRKSLPGAGLRVGEGVKSAR